MSAHSSGSLAQVSCQENRTCDICGVVRPIDQLVKIPTAGNPLAGDDEWQCVPALECNWRG